jgi:hypothetical protein
MSPAYSKADLVVEYYEKYIFDHAIFGDFAIGTNFNLSDEEVDHLILAARKVLRESPEFRSFFGQHPPEAISQ